MAISQQAPIESQEHITSDAAFFWTLPTTKLPLIHVDCPKEGEESTGGIHAFESGGINWIRTNMPRTTINCDDM